jgi:hypothetical protein
MTAITSQSELTYEGLLAMAVSPSQPGAYSGSPLGEAIGLHVHYEGEPVHVVVDGTKVAEVDRDSTWFSAARYLTPDQRAMQARLPGYQEETISS